MYVAFDSFLLTKSIGSLQRVPYYTYEVSGIHFCSELWVVEQWVEEVANKIKKLKSGGFCI